MGHSSVMPAWGDKLTGTEIRDRSGTRKEERLIDAVNLARINLLRRSLSELKPVDAMESLGLNPMRYLVATRLIANILVSAPIFVTSSSPTEITDATALRRLPTTLNAAAAVAHSAVTDPKKFYAFAKAHIQGAINVPADEVKDLAAQLPRDKTLVTYCWNHY